MVKLWKNMWVSLGESMWEKCGLNCEKKLYTENMVEKWGFAQSFYSIFTMIYTGLFPLLNSRFSTFCT